MLVAQRPYTACIHDKCCFRERLSDPSYGECSKDVTVSNEHDIALLVSLGAWFADDWLVVLFADFVNQVIDAIYDLLWRFAPGTAVAPYVPIGSYQYYAFAEAKTHEMKLQDLPMLIHSLLAPLLPDFGPRGAPVAAIVPFANV